MASLARSISADVFQVGFRVLYSEDPIAGQVMSR
jgi:hypothetical protein